MERSERKAGRKKELSNHIEVGMGFEELMGALAYREEDKIWKANEEENRQEEVGGILPTIQEEGGAESVSEEHVGGFETEGESATSGNFGIYGYRGDLSERRGADADGWVLGNAELGGAVMS